MADDHQAGEACPLCGSASTVLHRGLTDTIFGVPGEYQLDRCSNPSCRLVWLDGMPDEAHVGDFYANYYTHDTPQPAPTSAPKSGVRRLFGKLWPIGQQRRLRQEMYAFFLPDAGGTVLEMGCGSGRNLAALRDRGWNVLGQDIDPAAAAGAHERYGLDVEVGSIDELQLADGSMDAVLMNHVVEHLREPVRDLRKSRELLAPGGRLVIVTPNIDSLGAKVFGRRWRGLEPPRHLFIYNVATLRRRLLDAGFSDVQVFTRGARSEMITFDTIEAMIGQRPPELVRYIPAKLAGVVMQVWSSLARVDAKDRGDELVAIAVK